MILEEETYEKLGYYPSVLKSKSSKKILVKCDNCGGIRVIRKADYHAFCRTCAQKRKKVLKRKYMELNNKKWLEYKYQREKLSTGKIAKIIKCCEETIRKALKRHGIKIRSLSESKSDILNPNYGKHHSEEAKQKIRETRMHCSFPTHHTKPELIFERICKNNNLDFHYVGDGSLWIGKKGEKKLNPDFIEANGKKICIEIMGAWWHSPLLNKNLREDAMLSYRKRHYKKYKWQSIFIWDTDLLRMDAEAFVLNLLKNYEK